MNVLEKANSLQEQIITWRRDLHRIPEVGLDLPQTAGYIKEALGKLRLIPMNYVNGSGVTAVIEGDEDGPTVALRADTDALPVREETGLPFASTNGNMHACGHDAHAAMLLGAAAILSEYRETMHGRVKLIFQPGEENLGGARNMVSEGVLKYPDVDALFGMHAGNLGNAPSGMLSFREGTLMASFDCFEVTVTGRGCHGARPEDGVDPIVVSAQIISALQTIVSRECAATDPAVVTVGSIHGGSTYNIIPDTVKLMGSMRACTPETREKLKKRFVEICTGVASTLGAKAEVSFLDGYRPTVNDAGCTALAMDVARELFGEERVESLAVPSMVSEDVSEYLARVPGCFWFFSTPGACASHHNCKFDIEEARLWEGSAMLAAVALRYLEENAHDEA